VLVQLSIASSTDMHALGARIGRVLRPHDVLVLSGPLGAGKTKLVQGIGDGMQVEGQITSPTFVVSRIHKSLVGGPSLVHVDAYRISGLDDLETLGLDELSDAALVMEWGAAFVHAVSESYLNVDIERGDEGTDDEPESGMRIVTLSGIGTRWTPENLSALTNGESS